MRFVKFSLWNLGLLPKPNLWMVQRNWLSINRTDMEDLFLDNRVRYFLKALTGYDPMKVFPIKSLDNLKSPKYRFMTDEQLQMEKNMADERAESMLQMPPVKYPKEDQIRVLEKDVALQGFLDPSVKLVFLDATPGYSDNERFIVVRQADGTLREATREERHRTNQIFYPVEERHIDMPQMFDEPYLTNMLDRGAYKLLLDNACLHYEPEDPKYVQICHQTYDHIAVSGQFDLLWSTRHYGGMVFYLVFYKKADPLLYHLISMPDRLNEAYNLLCLYYIINPKTEVPNEESGGEECTQPPNQSIVQIHRTQSERPVPLEKLVDLLKIYIKHDSNSNLKSRLQLVMQKLEEKLSRENKDSENLAN